MVSGSRSIESTFLHYCQKNLTNISNWYQAFIDRYQSEYKYFTHDRKKLSSLVKENDLERLKQMDIEEGYGNLVLIASEYKHQAILDYFFNNFVIPAFTKPDRTLEYYECLSINSSNKRRQLTEWAARCNQLSFIPELVKCGVIQKLLERENMTMIVDAAYYRHIQFVRELLALGFDVNAKCRKHEYSLLMIAAFDNYEMAKLLIEKGANVNDQTEDHVSALTIAAEGGKMILYACY